jgi:signal transduction histidine kinase
MNGKPMSDLTESARPATEFRGAGEQLRLLASGPERDKEDQRKDLIDMAVHDMRNAVTSAILRLDMIESDSGGQLTTNQDESLRLAKWNLFKLSGMITNLLETSRIESDNTQVRKTVVDVQGLIANVVEAYAAPLESERIITRITVDPDAVSIMCDERLLERILSNLISNAIKHSHPGGEISVRVLCAETKGSVLFRIQDFGEGIPAEYHERIFERFFQVEMRRLGHGGDLGLGLAFCKMAVEALGGEIWVESAPGKGSCFTFLLPEALMPGQTH